MRLSDRSATERREELQTAILTELGDWSASTRYRAIQHLPRLRERLGRVDLLCADDRPERAPGRTGQVSYFMSHAKRYLDRWIDLRHVLGRYDAILVQRGLYALGPSLVAEPVSSFRGRVVFDLDDAVFSMNPAFATKSRTTQWLYGPQQSRRVLERADSIVVSTSALAQDLPIRSAEAIVMPTVLDASLYPVSDQLSVDARIGWVGTNGGLIYLDSLREVFRRLRDENVGSLEIVSSVRWSGPAEFRYWSLEEETTVFSRFAVGIMPLPDTAYTRAKAGFKLLQYMAAGVPVVASPVGVNVELVRDSGAGFLAATADEWDAALRRLLADSALRAKLGLNGRRFIQRYADLDAQADLLASLLTQ